MCQPTLISAFCLGMSSKCIHCVTNGTLYSGGARTRSILICGSAIIEFILTNTQKCLNTCIIGKRSDQKEYFGLFQILGSGFAKSVCTPDLSPVSTKPAVPGVPGAGAGNAGNRREWKSGMVLGRPGAGLGVSTGPAGGTHTFLLEKLNQI